MELQITNAIYKAFGSNKTRLQTERFGCNATDVNWVLCMGINKIVRWVDLLGENKNGKQGFKIQIAVGIFRRTEKLDKYFLFEIKL